MKRFKETLLELVTGPIQLREMRATFRGWRFSIVFTLSLALALFILWISAFAMMLDRENSSDVGQVCFLTLLGIQAGLIGLLVPGYAGTSIVRERDQSTLELLATTTLRPGHMVWGQFVAAMGYVAVYLFATLPLMAFPFWFGGLVGWEPLVAYLGLFLFAGLVSMWSIYVSATSQSLARATIMSYAFVLVTMGPFFSGLIELIDDLSDGRTHLAGVFDGLTEHALPISLTVAYSLLAAVSFLFLAAVNRMKPHGANRSTPMRAYAILAFPLFAALVFGLLNHYFWNSPREERHTVVYAGWFIVALYGVATSFQATEGAVDGKRLRNQLHRLRGWKWPLRILYPGGTRGFSFCMILTTLVVAGTLLYSRGTIAQDAIEPNRAFFLIGSLIIAQVFFASGVGLFFGSLFRNVNLARAGWFFTTIAVPAVSSVWQVATYNEFPDVLSWGTPGYLCFPYVLLTAWGAVGTDKPMPEVAGHTPVIVPFILFHLGIGLVATAVGWIRVRRAELEAARVDAPETPAPATLPRPEPLAETAAR